MMLKERLWGFFVGRRPGPEVRDYRAVGDSRFALWVDLAGGLRRRGVS